MLRKKGIGVTKKRAPAILPHTEKQLWDKKVLNTDTPEGLLNAVFYYNRKFFCLHGIQEQYQLRFSQLIRHTNPDRYT